MKNGKRIAAIMGIVLLLAVFCAPLCFAAGMKEFNLNYFYAALAVVFFVPVMAYGILVMYRYTHPKKTENKSEKIDNIIFDVGQVLLVFDWEKLMDQFDFADEKRKKIVEAVFGSKIWDERDQGLYPEKDYVDRMVALAPEYEEDIRAFMKRTPESISNADYVLPWVKYLKQQGYHLYILSNYCEYMLHANRPQMDFLRYMDGVVFSCEAKKIKPHADIYRHLLDTYHLDPKRSVFLDDRQENLDMARKMGIQTILFKNFKQAAAELDQRFDVR